MPDGLTTGINSSISQSRSDKIGVVDRRHVRATFYNAMLYSRQFRPNRAMAVALPSGREQESIRRDGPLDKITRRTQC